MSLCRFDKFDNMAKSEADINGYKTNDQKEIVILPFCHGKNLKSDTATKRHGNF